MSNLNNNNNFAIQFNNYEEIDERLFDSYLTISDNKSKSSILPSVEMSSSSSSGEESDASSHKASSFNNNHKTRNNNSRKNHTKPCKKEETVDSSASSVHSGQQEEVPEKKQKSLYKTELCRNWEETNHCRYGMKCQYAHGAADLREIDRHPKYKTQKCRTFHQTGACPYGNRCTFRHFNLPGDALEMKNLEIQEEEQRQQQKEQQQQQQPQKCPKHQQKKAQPPKVELVKEERPSIFSMDNQKLLQQNWFLNSNTLNGLGVDQSIPKRNMMLNNTGFDPEDSLLPSNAESLLPHQLLFDLESPEDEEEKQPARCPLRNYVNLPSFSTFQVPNHSQYMQQNHQQQDEQCKTFFRPWLF